MAHVSTIVPSSTYAPMFTYDGIRIAPLAMKAAAARHGRRHDADAAGFHLGFSGAGELRRDLVVEAEVARFHDDVVTQAERQQDGLLDPLMRGPPAHACARRHAQTAGVEFRDHVLDGLAQFRCGAGRC